MPDPFSSCGPGEIWDDFSGGCVPIFNPVWPPIPGTQATGANVNVTVNVAAPPAPIANITNQLDIQNTGIEDIATQINNAIQDAAKRADNAVSDTLDTIDNNLKSFLDSLGGWVKDGISSLWDTLKAVGSFVQQNLDKLGSFLSDHLGHIIGDITSAVSKVLVPIADTVSNIASQIKAINDNLIQPIANVINGTIQTISALTTAIEGDLHAGLSGILQIPGDISSALGTLDATMQRTVQQLGAYNKDVVSVTLGGTADDTIHTRLSAIHSVLSGITGNPAHATTLKDWIALPEPDLAQAGAATFDAIWKEVTGFISSMVKGSHGTTDALKTLFAVIPFAIEGIEEWPLLVVGAIGAFVEGMIPLFKFIEEDVAAKAGLAKLTPGDALNAWRRNLISSENLAEELGANGWNEKRMEVLRDLQTVLLDVQTIVDMFHRGIVTQEDLFANLQTQGINGASRDALLQQSYRIVSPELALTAFKRGIIQWEDFEAILLQNRYTDIEQGLIRDTIQRPENVIEYMARLRRQYVRTEFLDSDPNVNHAPQEIFQLALQDGISNAVAENQWESQFVLPSLGEFIQLVFRGLRTHTELDAFMNYYRVPKTLRNDIVQLHSALIPFRTIPTMLANGIITEPYAKQQLQAHGFNLVDTEALIKYAQIAHSKTKVASSGNLQALSIGAAREFFDLGTITELQYHDVLIAHGYDENTAQLTITTEKIVAHSKERRQIANDIVNEVLAGLITVDDAQSQMAHNNFTVAESAKVLKSINRVKRTATKTPGEAELKKMVEKNVISLDDYKNALATIGYAQSWIDRIVNLNFSSLVTANG